MRKTLLLTLLIPAFSIFAQDTKTKSSAITMQQEVRYTIEARLDTTSKQLAASMTIFYRNLSADSLTSFYLQVPANAYTDQENTAVREMQRFNRGNMEFNEGRGHELTIQSLQFLEIGQRTSFPLQAFDFSDTILDLPLPVGLAPGDSMKIAVYFVRDYERRFRNFVNNDSSTIHFDFVDWFPRVPAYLNGAWQVEPFHFMMESADVLSSFAQMDVTVSVPGHFIVAGSGDIVQGDPGWQAVLADTAKSDSAVIAWHDSLKHELFVAAKKHGERTIRFHNSRAQRFLWSTSPNMIYYRVPGPLPIHLVARGSHNRVWERETMQRLDTVMTHIAEYFGAYPFHDLTIVESRTGIEAIPGYLMNSDEGDFSLSIGFSRMYVPGVTSLDGVRQSWFSKGLSTFLGKRANEQRYGSHGYPEKDAKSEMNWWQRRYPLPSLDQAMRNFSLLYMESGQNEAISKSINDYSDPISAMFNLYMKSEIFFEMLAYVIGEQALQQSIRELVTQYQYTTITELELQRTCEQHYGESLEWFFKQWLHGTPTVDYAKGEVRQFQKNDTTWVTEVEVKRKGDGIMPIDVLVEGKDGKPIVQRWDGKDAKGKVVFETPVKPRGIKVDPHNRVMDTNMLNNGVRRFELHPDLPLLKLLHMPSDAYLILWRPHIGLNHIDGLRLGLGARGSYRSFYNNLSAEVSVGTKSSVVDGKLAYNHPLRHGNLLNRYSLMGRKMEGRFELDAHLSLNGSDGLIAANGRSLEFGVSYSGLFKDAYTIRTVSSDTGKAVFQEWDDLNVMLGYVEGQWRFGSGRFDLKNKLRGEAGWPEQGEQFTKLSGSSELRYRIGPFAIKARGNAGASFGADTLPLQDQFRAEGASARERYSHDLVRSGGDYLSLRRRTVEGGGNLRGYAGQPLAVKQYLSANFEAGPRKPLLALQWFAFYDAGRMWPISGGDGLFRANAGIGAAFLGGLSPFFGGNLPIFEGLSARLYFPLWLSDPLPGEKNLQFRWFFALGKQL